MPSTKNTTTTIFVFHPIRKYSFTVAILPQILHVDWIDDGIPVYLSVKMLFCVGGKTTFDDYSKLHHINKKTENVWKHMNEKITIKKKRG